MADNVLQINVFDVRPKVSEPNSDRADQNKGAWVKGSIYMGKDKQTGAYNDGLWVSLHFPETFPQPRQKISVSCYGMGWDTYTVSSTGEVRNTPKFNVTSWHVQTQAPQQGYGAQQHPPTSSYQNQQIVPF